MEPVHKDAIPQGIAVREPSAMTTEFNGQTAVEGQREATEAEKTETAWVMPELMEKSAIKKEQDGIRRTLVKLDANVHSNAVQCLIHAEKHGDTSLMRRLLVEIIDSKSGYRRQGLISWMRAFSPMELVGDTIKLTGTLADGTRKPFDIKTADKTPFASAREFAEVTVKPFFRESFLSKLEAARREYDRAKSNTVDGKPIDKTKAFWSGLHTEDVDTFFASLDEAMVKLEAKPDNTRDVHLAKEQLNKANLEAEAIKKTA